MSGKYLNRRAILIATGSLALLGTADGNVHVPIGLGWGVNYDWDFINAHKIDEKVFK